MISIHNPIKALPWLCIKCYNSLMEHLLEPVCCSFAVHWMFATLNIAFGASLDWLWYLIVKIWV